MKCRNANRLICGALCAAAIAAFATTAKANTILSDNFNAGPTGASPPNVDSHAYPNWTEQNFNVAPTSSVPVTGHDFAPNPAAILDGANSMQVHGEVYQAFSPVTSAFDVSFEFAVLAPSSSNRTLTMYLSDDTGTEPYSDSKINFRIYNDGTNYDMQVYNGSAFVNVGPAGVANSIFSASLTAAPVTVNTLSVDGTFHGTGSSYSITLNGTTYSGLTAFQKGSASGSGVTPVDFASVDFGISTATDFVVDDVSITSTPEPASLALFALGALGMLIRPRRRNRTVSPC